MQRGTRIACVCLLTVFLAALVTSRDYSLSDALGPGPGFFPFWLSLIGAGLAAGIFVQETRRAPDTETAALLPQGKAALRAGAVIVALAVAAALIEPLGFRLTMLAFVAALLPALGARSVVAISLTAIGGSFGVFHVFYYWLKVPLPIGAFGL